MPPQRILTIASNKGGVGKTTLAANLAIYLRALHEDLPILVLSLDDQPLIGRLFAIAGAPDAGPDVREALRRRDLAPAVRLGQYGIHYVPPCPTLADGDAGFTGPFELAKLLAALAWPGVVVIDTKSDLGTLTRNALAASDLTLLAVADQTSLDQAERVYGLFDEWGKPRSDARIVLSLVDRRVKYREGESSDLLALLLAEIRTRRHPCFETFLSRSPKIETLYTNAAHRPLSILHGAPGSLVHRQMRHLACDVAAVLQLDATDPPAWEARDADLAAPNAERRRSLRRPFRQRVPAFPQTDATILALEARDVSIGGMAIAPCAELPGDARLHVHLASPNDPSPLLVWARVERREPDRTALRFELGADLELKERVARFVAALDSAA